MYVWPVCGYGHVSACACRGSCEPLDMGINKQTVVLCRSTYMLFSAEPPFYETGSVINSARTAGQWVLWILLSLELLSAGLCAWLLRHTDLHVCVLVRWVHYWQPSPQESSLDFKPRSLTEPGVCLALHRHMDSVLFVVLGMDIGPCTPHARARHLSRLLSSWLSILGLTMQLSLALSFLHECMLALNVWS